MEEVRQYLTKYFKTERGEMELWPVQAAALRDIHDYKGAFLPVSVGRGKALISLLAAEMLGAKRPILLVPAALREQTNLKVIPEMRVHWRLHPQLKVVGYSEISLAKNAKLLEQYMPDMLICDEVHALKSLTSGRTKRVRRYVGGNPACHFVGMSGTVCHRSIMDYAHLLEWCLGELQSPLPTYFPDLRDWANCIDEDVMPENRMAPGALRFFRNSDDEPIQIAYRRRLTETGGVVASLGDDDVGASLVVRCVKPRVPPAITQAITQMRNTWATPNGDIILNATDLSRHAKELAMGFWYAWDPAPPMAWMKARSAWRKYVSHTLSHNRRGLDTEFQVWAECEDKDDPPEWRAWKAIKDSFVINTVAVWVHDFVVDYAVKWMRDNPSGIVWTTHTALGQRIAQKSGNPYYGAGEDASRAILDASGPIIASIPAHGTGKNLQAWDRGLVPCSPSSGKSVEQLIGRNHRAGQKSDEVGFDFLLHTDDLKGSFDQVLRDSRYLEDSLGGRIKMNYASILSDD